MPASNESSPDASGLDVDGRQYLRLRQEILDRVVSPGELLLETALSARYGVSRTPIRAALIRLEHDGLVERASRGYQVRVGSAEEILDIYEARIAMEAVAASAAARRRTDLELARLIHLQAEAEASTDHDTAGALHRQWHEVMWGASHNRAIVSTLVRLCSQLTIFDFAPMVDPPNVDASNAEHRDILDAIAAGDAQHASEAVTKHLNRTRETRLAAFARNGR